MSLESPDDPSIPDLDEREREALHEIELGLEWLQRAQGELIEFHHATGHGMDHLDEAEQLLRESGRDDLADQLRDQLLPRGVLDGDRWSYDVLEGFQREFLATVVAFESEAREELADGARHVAERHQEEEWKRRSEDW